MRAGTRRHADAHQRTSADEESVCAQILARLLEGRVSETVRDGSPDRCKPTSAAGTRACEGERFGQEREAGETEHFVLKSPRRANVRVDYQH